MPVTRCVNVAGREAMGEAPCWEYFGSQPAEPRLRDLDRLLKPALADSSPNRASPQQGPADCQDSGGRGLGVIRSG